LIENNELTEKPKAKVLSVAPMMDWTDRHCRFFLRLFNRHVHLYTEMVTTGALIYGDRHRFYVLMRKNNPLFYS
jgi:tRNA-dihydrouridine synthase A